MLQGELVARVAANFGMDTTVASEELGFLEAWANEGVRDVLVKTKCHVEPGEINLQANLDEYFVESSVLSLVPGSLRGVSTPVRIVDAAELYYHRRTGALSQDPVTLLALVGDYFLVYPKPKATGTLPYLYVPKPGEMTSSSNDPASLGYGGIPEEFHDGIELYMSWMASKYKGTTIPLGPRDYAQFYANRIKEIKRELRRGIGRPPPVPGYPPLVNVGRRNDVYP